MRRASVSNNDETSGPFRAASTRNGSGEVELSAGEARAFEELYALHSESMRRYAIKLLRSDCRAEDIVQQAFASTMAAAERGVAIEQPERYLHRCVRNLCLNELRGKPIASLSEAEHDPSFTSLADQTHVKSQYAAIHGALFELPESQRSVFLLSEVRGLSYGEISSVTGHSIDSVRKLLFRARRRVRTTVGTDSALLGAPLLDLVARGEVGVPWQVRLRVSLQERLGRAGEWFGTLGSVGGDGATQLAARMTVVALVVGALGLSSGDGLSTPDMRASQLHPRSLSAEAKRLGGTGSRGAPQARVQRTALTDGASAIDGDPAPAPAPEGASGRRGREDRTGPDSREDGKGRDLSAIAATPPCGAPCKTADGASTTTGAGEHTGTPGPAESPTMPGGNGHEDDPPNELGGGANGVGAEGAAAAEIEAVVVEDDHPRGGIEKDGTPGSGPGW